MTKVRNSFIVYVFEQHTRSHLPGHLFPPGGSWCIIQRHLSAKGLPGNGMRCCSCLHRCLSRIRRWGRWKLSAVSCCLVRHSMSEQAIWVKYSHVSRNRNSNHYCLVFVPVTIFSLRPENIPCSLDATLFSCRVTVPIHARRLPG